MDEQRENAGPADEQLRGKPAPDDEPLHENPAPDDEPLHENPAPDDEPLHEKPAPDDEPLHEKPAPKDDRPTRPAGPKGQRRTSDLTAPVRAHQQQQAARLAAEEDAIASRGTRAQRRSAWVLTALALLLTGLFLYALLYNFSGQADRDADRAIAAASAARPTKTVPPAGPTPLVEANTVKVVVLNGTGKAGLARSVGDELIAQGFNVVKVGNGSATKGVAEIQFGVPGRVKAEELARRFPDATLKQDARKDDTVTVVIGAGFKRVEDPYAQKRPQL